MSECRDTKTTKRSKRGDACEKMMPSTPKCRSVRSSTRPRSHELAEHWTTWQGSWPHAEWAGMEVELMRVVPMPNGRLEHSHAHQPQHVTLRFIRSRELFKESCKHAAHLLCIEGRPTTRGHNGRHSLELPMTEAHKSRPKRVDRYTRRLCFALVITTHVSISLAMTCFPTCHCPMHVSGRNQGHGADERQR